MLDNLRNFGKTIPGKVLGGFLLLGLAGFGVSGVLTTIGSNVVARVGDQEISTREFGRVYQQQLNLAAQRLGSVPTVDQAISIGVPTTTLSSLVGDAALNSIGSRMGLGISDQRLAGIIRQDPAFAGILGGFERSQFELALQQSGYTESEFFNLQSRAAQRQQLSAALFADIPAPDAAAEIFMRFTDDLRSIDYFTINSATMDPVAEPTEAELAAYLSENQARFRSPETRVVRLTYLSPDVIAEGLTVEPAVVEAEYERTKDSLVRQPARRVRQVVPGDDATAFEEGLAEGKTFDALVSELSLEVTDLGVVTRSEIPDEALGEAAFGLSDGETVLIAGVAGQRAVTVSEIDGGGPLSLAEARDDIEASLKRAEARNSFIDILDQIEELRAAFRPMDEIADRFGLDVKLVPLTAAGPELSVVEGIPADQRARVAQTIFTTDPDGLAPSIALGANLNVWFDIESVSEARDLTLDEVRTDVREIIVAQRTQDALRERAEALVARLDDGESISDVAASENAIPEFTSPFPRSGDSQTVVTAAVANAVFDGGPDNAGAAPSGDGEYLVFKVNSVVPAQDADETQARQFAQQSIGNTVLSQFVTRIQNEAGYTINETVLTDLIGLTANGQPVSGTN